MEDALRLSRDGGIVCALFLMAAAIAYALFTAVEVFAEASYKGPPAGEQSVHRRVRLLAAAQTWVTAWRMRC